ncbi:hypothetical protein C4D60_Mb04t30120 [Musa balbisiana]|uniref:Uncharacterized protein n=1 Tax=Musa balbisiana TaxID=52838 RepID=A0A4S8KFP5_MUSBA|nr:hypothetical protein C4D60_Mb04t30120 [Musa balbisiana]
MTVNIVKKATGQTPNVPAKWRSTSLCWAASMTYDHRVLIFTFAYGKESSRKNFLPAVEYEHHFSYYFSSFPSPSGQIADSHPRSRAAGGRQTPPETDSLHWWQLQPNLRQHQRTAGSIRQPWKRASVGGCDCGGAPEASELGPPVETRKTRRDGEVEIVVRHRRHCRDREEVVLQQRKLLHLLMVAGGRNVERQHSHRAAVSELLTLLRLGEETSLAEVDRCGDLLLNAIVAGILLAFCNSSDVVGSIAAGKKLRERGGGLRVQVLVKEGRNVGAVVSALLFILRCSLSRSLSGHDAALRTRQGQD